LPAAETKTLQPGQEIEIPFADAGLPPTLYSMMNGDGGNTVRDRPAAG
jgi:hypothetical protein